MSIVQRAKKRFFLVIAAQLTDWGLFNEFAIKGIAMFEARGTHPLGRAHAFRRFLGVRNDERSVFAAQKTGRVEGLQFFAFTEIKALADVNKSGNRRISGTEGTSDHGAGVWRGVGGVPLILVPRVENETEIASGIGTNQRGAVHHAGDIFKALREFDVVHDRVDLREGAEDLVGFNAAFEGSITFRIESFGVGHTARHPQDDDGIGSRRYFLFAFGEDLTWKAGAQGGKRGGAGGFKKVATCHDQIIGLLDKWIFFES